MRPDGDGVKRQTWLIVSCCALREVLGGEIFLERRILNFLLVSLPSSIILQGPDAPAWNPTGVTSTVHSNCLAAGRICLEYWKHFHVSCMAPHFVSVHIQKFRNNGLLQHEKETNKLREEGDRVETKHPGSPAIIVRLSATSDIRN